MKKACLVVCLVLAVLILGVNNSYAQEGKFALTAKTGTLGLGLEGVANINPKLNAKLGFNTFKYDYDGTESDIEYNIDLDLLTFSALVDWFPFESGFRLSGGVLVNENSADLSAKTSASYQIGDTIYTASQVGSLSGEVNFDDIAPYFGLGWGNPFGKESNWSFNFDIGAMYQGKGKINLNANGTLASDSAFLANLAREEENLESEIEDYEFYPVVSFGISYKF